MDEGNKIELFENRRIRTAWDGEKEEWFFSVSDVVAVLTDSADVKQYIKKMRNRDVELNSKWGTICTPVEMVAADGKMRHITAANAEGILRLVQSIPSKKAEPFRMWLAQVARRGGRIAGNTRREIEADTGRPVITSKNATQLDTLVTGMIEGVADDADNAGGTNKE
ncbi:MAG: Bro-N domain-containing protein [Coriobacteriales bacterium]|nr:Bro-N domain-containing protein [Coriobacteriales bacterium]